MFTGTYTAITTPFAGDGGLDEAGLRALVERQVAGGVDGVVPVGTTGESPTLSMDEHRRVIELTIETVAGRCKVVAGTGANSTAEAVELTEFAKAAGADGTLQVTPYYNKPSQEGLFRHFSAVADVGLPVVLYNVPGRSALAISIETASRLATHEHVVAIKEAAGSVDRVSELLQVCDLTVLSGDDGLTLPMMSVGAKGVISVLANVLPKEMSDLTHAALGGDWATAQELHARHYQLMCDMFIDTNPVPVKAAMAMAGLCEEVYRLPLCELNDEARGVLRASLSASGVL